MRKEGAEINATVGCAGKPVTGALVTVFLWDSPVASRLSTRTDKEGRFFFSGLPTAPVWLLITADGVAPGLQKVEPGTNSISILDVMLG
jgi:hypothetical protein